MALACNGNMGFYIGVKSFGARAYLSAYPAQLPSNSNQTNRIRNITAGEGITDELVGLPSGYRHPGAWMLPQKPGAISSRNTVTGSGVVSGSAQSGYNIDGTLTGSGDIVTPSLGLIIQIAAALTASGGVSSATAGALASMVASLTGSSSVAATASGLATLGASLLASGAITANNTALMSIGATIRGYSDLSPEGLRDAVWNAVASNYDDIGTMGELLNNASGGGGSGASAADVWSYGNRSLTDVANIQDGLATETTQEKIKNNTDLIPATL